MVEMGREAAIVFDVLGTARAMRYLKPEPVPDDLLERLVWAGTRASSANNTQPWEFITVTSPEQRRRVAEAVAPFLELVDSLPAPTDASEARTRSGSTRLIAELATVPALIFVCGRNDYPASEPREFYLWSAVFSAAQNILVAARALGLGAALTTLHVANPAAIRDLLGLPAGLRIGAMIAVGWPDRPFGPVKRRPLQEVLHRDRW